MALFLKKNNDLIINAISNVAVNGDPCYINDIIKFLNNRNKEIREVACNSIIHLFSLLDGKTKYYNTLKYCDIKLSDIDKFKLNFTKNQFCELLLIASLNHNGFVREKAIKNLEYINNPRAIKFLLFRLADWVLPVSQSAYSALKKYKTEEYLDELINNINNIEKLKVVEHIDLTSIYNEIIAFITVENKNYIYKNIYKFNDKQRFLLASHLSKNITNNSSELKILINDRNYLIRFIAIDHFDLFEKEDIDKLLNDKSAKVRLQILYRLNDKNKVKEILKNYLADKSSSIRLFARFYSGIKNEELAEFYIKNLKNEFQVVGSLLGLAEINAKQYSETIKEYLFSNNIKIKKTAFLALGKLNEEITYNFAMENLNCRYPGLRKIIIDFLSNNHNPEILIKAREIFKFGNEDIKISMLKLFARIGSWSVISDLMIGTIDENENVRDLANNYLSLWKMKSVNLFVKPKKEDFDKTKMIFNLVKDIHDENNYFSSNPLDEMEDLFK